jgi:nucleoside-diphosphate-sugar epimerase
VLTVPGDPSEVLDLLHATDAAEAIARCCVRTGIRTLNIVSGVPVTWREVVLALAATGGGATEVLWDGSVTNWASARRFSPARAERELGPFATLSLEEGIALVVAAARARRDGPWS